MNEVDFSEIAEEIIRDKANEIVNRAISTYNDITKDDLINLVVELLKEFDKRR